MILLVLGLLASDATITGVIKDVAGRPAAGVSVTLATRSMLESDSVPETASATSDPNGRFSLLEPASLRREYSSGDLIAFDSTRGIAAATVLPSNPVSYELQFGTPTGTEITVVDAAGKPVAGATLSPERLQAPGIRTLPPTLAKQMAVVTDADGRARFTSLDSKQIGQLRVATRDGVAFTLLYLRGPADWTQVQLPPVANVRGKLTGAIAQGLRGPGSVFVACVGKETTHRFGRSDRSTDRRRLVHRTGVKGGNWSVRLKSDDVLVTNASPWAPVKPESSEKNWNVASTVPVTGVVRSTEGAPVRDAAVVFTAGSIHRQFTTGEDGRYSGRVPPGKPQRSMHLTMEYESEQREAELIDVAAGPQAVELKAITVTPAATVSGVVLDDSNKPAAGALVMASCTSGDGIGTTTRYRRAISGKDGAFRIAGVPKSSSIVLRAFHAGRGAYTDGVAASPNGKEETLKLSRSESVPLAIAVVDDFGKPIEARRSPTGGPWPCTRRRLAALVAHRTLADDAQAVGGTVVVRYGAEIA